MSLPNKGVRPMLTKRAAWIIVWDWVADSRKPKRQLLHILQPHWKVSRMLEHMKFLYLNSELYTVWLPNYSPCLTPDWKFILAIAREICQNRIVIAVACREPAFPPVLDAKFFVLKGERSYKILVSRQELPNGSAEFHHD